LSEKDTIRRIARGRTEKEVAAAIVDAQHRLTPNEFMRLAERSRDLPEEAREWAKLLLPLVRGSATHIRSFKREDIRADITRYSSKTGIRSKKTLILVFSGLKGGPMLPVPVLLQLLPEEFCDLVLIRDKSRTLFASGLPPDADSFIDLLRLLEKLIVPGDYARFICYGGSGGGFPALRAALLMGASRGVSASGRSSWNIRRLLDGSGRQTTSFDPLCHCFRDTRTEIVCAYGAGNLSDVADAHRVAAVFPVRLRPLPGIAVHNFLWELAQTGKVQEFINEAFDFAVPSVTEQLAALVDLGGGSTSFPDRQSATATKPGRRNPPKKHY
jgi:hypothetical protein